MNQRSKYLISLTLIFTGVIMTSTSALLSDYIVSKNQKRIETLQSDSQSKEKLITQLWQDYQVLEQKKDTLLILIASNSSQHYITLFSVELLTSIGVENPKQTLLANSNRIYPFTMENMNRYKQETLQKINNIYEEKVYLDMQSNQLISKNSRYNSIALFFQIFGLILVLSKHIFE